MNSEDMLAFEMGYRFQTSKRLSFDFAGFYNQYHDLVALTLLPLGADHSPEFGIYKRA